MRDAGDSPPTVPFWRGEAPARTQELSEEVSRAARRASASSSSSATPTARARGSPRRTGIGPAPAAMIVDYVAAGRAVLGDAADRRPTRHRAVLRRHRRHAARHPLAVRRPDQPRVRARAAQEVLPHVRLRAAGRRERRRDRAVARAAPQLPARRGRALRQQPHGRGDVDPGLPRRADVHLALAVEPQPRAARAPVPRRAQEPAADPAHGSRRPHGRGVPAGRRVPGQPRRPGRDPRPRDRAPDDQRHAARGARRRRAARRCSNASRPAPCACTRSTRPNRPCSRTRSSRRSRTRSSTTRSSRTAARTRCTSAAGSSVELETIGRLDADAIRAVHAEITPHARDGRRPPRSPVLARHDAAPARVDRPVGAARRQRAAVASSAAPAASCGARPRCSTTRGVSPTATTRATTTAVRGHLELTGITTGDEVARATGLDRGRVEFALDGAAGRGLRDPGSLPRRRARSAVGVAPPARAHALVLAEVPAQRCRTRDEQDFMRFLLRWQHLAPGTQLRGVEGLATVIGRLQGWEAAAAAWEPELFARRLRDYEPATLDRLCHEGEIGWLRLSPRPPRRRRARGRAEQGDSGFGRAPRRPRLVARRGARRPGVVRAHGWWHRRGDRGAAGARRLLRGRAGDRDRALARRRRARPVGRRRPRDPHRRRVRRDPARGRPASVQPARRRSDLAAAARDAHAAGGRRPLVARARAERRHRP